MPEELEIYHDRGLAKNVRQVHGVNPVLLIEKIIRERIQDLVYWKLNCFGIDILKFVEKAANLKIVTGANIHNNPSHFQCLLMKLLQIQPKMEVIREFLSQRRFKYLTCLAMFYVRLVCDLKEVYQKLEPFLEDYRKIRFRDSPYTEVKLYHIDEFADDLLHKERVCDLILPRLVNRVVLEDAGELETVLDSESDSEEIDESEM